MNLTVFAINDQLVNVEVDGDMTVDTLKAILEAETQIPSTQQAFVVDNRVLKDSETLNAAGVKDGDVLQMMQAQQRPQGGAPAGSGSGSQAGQSNSQQQQNLAVAADGSAVNPMGFIMEASQNRELMGRLTSMNPRLHKAILESNVEQLQEVLRMAHKMRMEHEESLRKEQELLESDPFDLDAQRRIAELIEQKNIEENFMAAIEHSPELMTHTSMLYVRLIVNEVEVIALVDTGAQMTIMTEEFAQKCNLIRLMDRRYKGEARGVGSAPILGKVHQAPIKVGSHFIASSLTVLAQKEGPTFILGLDQMKRHQCTVDLKRMVLIFGGVDAHVPFLTEAEIDREIPPPRPHSEG